jgi:hypothetical protein
MSCGRADRRDRQGFVTCVGENDLMTLKSECGSPSDVLRDQVAVTLRTGGSSSWSGWHTAE